MNDEIGTTALSTAVITGGHSYDVRALRNLFSEFDGIDSYVQHLDEFCSSSRKTRMSYNVLVFYTMMPGKPDNDLLPGQMGKTLETLDTLGTRGQGIIVLHHALLSWPDWKVWDDVVGIERRYLDDTFSYHHDVTFTIGIDRGDHPVTRDLQKWRTTDETYEMNEPGEGSSILLTTDQADSMRCIAWASRYKDSRVLCLQLGHDAIAFANAGFREVLNRGILWCAGSP